MSEDGFEVVRRLRLPVAIKDDCVVVNKFCAFNLLGGSVVVIVSNELGVDNDDDDNGDGVEEDGRKGRREGGEGGEEDEENGDKVVSEELLEIEEEWEDDEKFGKDICIKFKGI